MSYQRLTLNTANLSIDWQTGSTKKVVVHHLNGLGLGGTEGMVQILLGWLSKYDKNYDENYVINLLNLLLGWVDKWK